MNRLFYFIIYLLISSSLLHSASPRIINDQTIHLIKAELEKELAIVKETDKKFHLYNMAANEFMSYQYYKEAKDYFHKAINLDTTIDKSFTYINLLSVTQTLGDKKEILKTYNESKTYFEKTKKINEPAIARYLASYESYLFPEKNGEQASNLYKMFALEEKIKTLIEMKKYPLALELFKETNIAKMKDGKLQVTYDLLNALQKKDSPLLCEKEYSQYPNAVTYVSIYCKLLKEKRSQIKISAKDKKSILDYLQTESGNDSYLFNLYKEIK